MLGAGGIGTVALLAVLLSWALRRRATAAGWCLGLSAATFLGSAVAGTAARIREAGTENRSSAAVVAEAPPEAGDNVNSAGGPSSVEPADRVEDAGEPEDVAERERAKAEGAPAKVVDVAQSPSPAPEALPSDPDARRSAAFEILREAKKVTTDERCTDPAALASAYERVAALPPDAFRSRAKVVVKRLETCRRKIAWIVRARLERDRVDAREAYAAALREKTDGEGKPLIARLTGMKHENIRIVDLSLAEESLEPALTPALVEELTKLGFVRAVYSNGKDSKGRNLEPPDVRAEIDAELAKMGLSEPLRLD